jgi:hypothetical protein
MRDSTTEQMDRLRRLLERSPLGLLRAAGV